MSIIASELRKRCNQRIIEHTRSFRAAETLERVKELQGSIKQLEWIVEQIEEVVNKNPEAN